MSRAPFRGVGTPGPLLIPQGPAGPPGPEGPPGPAGANGIGGLPTVLELGNLGSSQTVTITPDNVTWIVGTLNADLALTLTGLAEGAQATLLFTQDATGGHALTINGTSLAIPTASNLSFVADAYYDGTILYVALRNNSGTSSGNVIDGVTVTGTPTVGQVITATSATAADWQAPAGGAPSGAAGGDLSGTYPNPTVAKLNGVAAVAYALVQENVNSVATSGSAQTIPDVTTDTLSRITLTANCTFTFPTAAAGKSFLLVLVQDATGSRTATWPGTVKWPAGTAPTLTTTASKADAFSFVCADGTHWLGFTVGQNF